MIVGVPVGVGGGPPAVAIPGGTGIGGGAKPATVVVGRWSSGIVDAGDSAAPVASCAAK
jgi:hypothetical protein